MSSLSLPSPPSRFSVLFMNPAVVFIISFSLFLILALLGCMHYHLFLHMHFMSFISVFIVSFSFGAFITIPIIDKGWDQAVNERFSSATAFRDCNAVYQWIRQHPEVQPYVDAVKAQGRMLYLGDMLILEKWAHKVEQLREKEKMLEYQRAFCKKLYN